MLRLRASKAARRSSSTSQDAARESRCRDSRAPRAARPRRTAPSRSRSASAHCWRARRRRPARPRSRFRDRGRGSASVRWKLPSLLRTTPGATSAAQGRWSASRSARLRYSRKVQHARCPFWRRWRTSTGAKSGSRLAANTASVWPTAQRTRPAIHCCRPSPSAAAIVPLTIAIAARRAAEQDRLGRATGAAAPRSLRYAFGLSAAHAISAPPPKLKKAGRSSTRRTRSTGRRRSGSAAGSRRRSRRTPASGR